MAWTYGGDYGSHGRCGHASNSPNKLQRLAKWNHCPNHLGSEVEFFVPRKAILRCQEPEVGFGVPRGYCVN
ncbi:unnamed protein product [Linum trigynum]|uniref:Uncharacterized protein n=1 Tax=Linum trigynum TaxID=586398 RepID=A0AAV2FWS3_9ROSI